MFVVCDALYSHIVTEDHYIPNFVVTISVVFFYKFSALVSGNLSVFFCAGHYWQRRMHNEWHRQLHEKHRQCWTPSEEVSHCKLAPTCTRRAMFCSVSAPPTDNIWAEVNVHKTSGKIILQNDLLCVEWNSTYLSLLAFSSSLSLHVHTCGTRERWLGVGGHALV